MLYNRLQFSLNKKNNLKRHSFWFLVSILFYFLIVLISILVAIFYIGNLAVKISEYGFILYFLLTIILSLLFRKKHKDWSNDILKGFFIVFLFWLLFVIIFSFSFFIGFRFF